MTTILGIETSCDETAAAVVVGGNDVRSNVVASQIELHKKYGGVVPEIASRAHIEQLDSVIKEAMSTAKCTEGDIDAVAVTNRPGLIGSLLVGVTAAKTLSWAWNKPLLEVNHIHAHATSGAIGLDVDPWPAVALVVSGGHTTLFSVESYLSIRQLGATTDDAAGEAFDKVATILGLGYPGGPAIDRAGQQGDATAIKFPRTMLAHDSLDFSFSGVKTAVLYHVNGHGKTSGGLERLAQVDIANIAASFEQSVVDVLVKKTMLAAKHSNAANVMLGGGVAANRRLRRALTEECQRRELRLYATNPAYCTDNAAMIAALGYHKFLVGEFASLNLDAYPVGR